MSDATSERRLRRRSAFESSGETPLAPDAPSAALSPADVSPPTASRSAATVYGSRSTITPGAACRSR